MWRRRCGLGRGGGGSGRGSGVFALYVGSAGWSGTWGGEGVALYVEAAEDEQSVRICPSLCQPVRVCPGSCGSVGGGGAALYVEAAEEALEAAGDGGQLRGGGAALRHQLGGGRPGYGQ